MPQSSPVVHVVEDDDSLRTAVGRLLMGAGFEVRLYASVGDFVLAHREDVPGCIVLDVHLPGPSGLDLQAAFAGRSGLPPIIFITAFPEVAETVRAMKGGAADFLVKPVEPDVLLDAVRAAVQRDAAARAIASHTELLRALYGTLSQREREVFDRLVAGKLNKQIAAELGAAERTVKAHRAKVLEKMRVASIAELARAASELGVVPPIPVRERSRP